MPVRRLLSAAMLLAGLGPVPAGAQPQVGPADGGGMVVPTAQLIRAAGESVEIPSRPVDIRLTPDGKLAIAKDNRGLVVADAAGWEVVQELAIPKGAGSMIGLAVSPDGRTVAVTDTGDKLRIARFGEDGTLAWRDPVELPDAPVGGAPYPCGVAFLSPDRALVCLSRSNQVAIVSLADGEVEKTIDVGVAPFAIAVAADGATAWVTNRGGERPDGDDTATSSGTPTRIDARGIAFSGSVSVLDLADNRVAAEIEVGLSPGGLALSPNGSTLYVANSNADTVSVIDTGTNAVRDTVVVRPDESLPFGSMPSAVALTPDGRTLFVACAGNNAVAVLDIAHDLAVRGWIPTGWYPGGLATDGTHLYIANIKGVGSRTPRGGKPGSFNSHGHRGTLQRVAFPADAQLAAMTSQVLADARVPQVLRSLERSTSPVPPLPVPAKLGEPSVFEHVVYVIKENRTYDQVFGDMPVGNNDPDLCIYGREVTPNQHALAEQFALLDNFYCNGVLSADGHSWATEGNVTPYLERSFGGFVRSYTFGDDPLTYSSSGFVWDHVLAAGLSFRNYGEFDYAGITPNAGYFEVHRDWKDGTGTYSFTQNIGVANVLRYTCPDYPGWNMSIPDQLRADRFLAELDRFEKDGTLPNLVLIYLPNDHTSGTGRGVPTPRALVADNDLALGRIVEGISRSQFWPKTCIFVVEDDPQDGFDHVDGHRSTCLVISPYTRRGEVVSEFYNQTSVLHTMERILGVPPYNQLYALAPLMTGCFTDTPDPTPFEAVPNRIPLNEANPSAEGLHGDALRYAQESEAIDWTRFDSADEDTLNRILWHAAKGVDAPYPAEYAGAHAKGLAALGLRPARPGEWAGVEFDDASEDDDDD